MLKAEKIERVFEILFYVSYPLWVVLTFVYGNAGRLGIGNQSLPILQTTWLAFLREKTEDIRFGLDVLTEAMENEIEKPLEVVKLKEMLNEPASFKDVCAEIDSEPTVSGSGCASIRNLL